MDLTQIIVLFCALALKIDIGCSEGTDFVELAQIWAPKIHLYSQEQYWPGDVDVFLTQVSPQGDGCDGSLGLPVGAASQQCYLTTSGDPYDLLADPSCFLYGAKPPESVPAYASVRTCNDSSDHVVISYWLFFPFNEGKDMGGLVGKIPLVGRFFRSKNTVVGNHVGDWEHLSIELSVGQPVSLYLSVHDSGIFYNYDPATNTFQISSELKNGLLKIPNPPQTVLMDSGHPVLYCAQGSHAVWAAAGTFSYSEAGMSELTDVTDQGIAWNTWENLQVFYSPETTPSWWFYDGHWGNAASQCVLDVYCLFSAGPVGLSSRAEDYQC